MQRKSSDIKTVVRKGSKLRIGIILSDYYKEVADGLLAGVMETLHEWKVQDKNISTVRVPGGFEIPLAAQRMIKNKKIDAVITLGCVMKGETKHDEFIAMSVANALQALMMKYEKPIAFGVLTPHSMSQALARSSGPGNRGREAATAALEMVFN